MNSSSAVAFLLGTGLGCAATNWLRCSRVGLKRRRQLSSLKPPAQQLRRWIEAVPQGWLLINPHNRIASLNPRAELLLELDDPGLSLRGEPLAVVEPSDELQHLVDLARNTGFSQRGIWPLRTSNLDVRVMPGGEGWVAIVLQGRNPLESQLEQQEQWVSDVAHELKTPLTALRLVSDSLAISAEGRQAVLVERLQRELQRLQQLVSDLLDLSRLDNTPFNNSTPQPAVSPLDVLQAVWNILEPLALERKIRLSIQSGELQQCRAAIDAARLHQALFNLLDNALRFSPDQGIIEVDIRSRHRWSMVSVRDHGPGLSEVDQERMFQRFYRGDPARARSSRSGSGLGLAIVQQIALSQGGMVRASNHPEGGAVLELLMPRAS